MEESFVASSTWVTMGRVASILSTQHGTRNTPQRLPDWLGRQAAAGGDRLAVGAPGVRWTFADLDREAGVLAGRLRALGVEPGDHIAVLMGNSAGYAAVLHACIRLDAVLVPLNIRLAPAELHWELADSGARLLIHDAKRADLALAAAEGLPGLGRYLIGGAAEPGTCSLDEVAPTSVPPHAGIDLDRVHCVIYTSGTTGRPKGALLTYGNHWWSAVGSALNLGTSATDRWLACLPLFHVGGQSILLKSVIYGVPVFIHESFDPVAINRAIDEDGISHISVVSAMLTRMLDARGAAPYPPTLRTVLLGGGPAPRPLLEACAARGVPVVQTYGLTESASQAVTLAPGDALRKLGSAGRPLLPMEMQVVDPDGRSIAPGAVGEIILRGPTITPGYLGRPDATAAALRDGWLHTGDLGYLDDDGYLYVVDRRDDLIISGGENVYPAEVEAVLLAHPAVTEAGVVGVPDARWGQVVRAVVSLQPGATTAADLIAFCRERLARYKVPAEIVFMAALPRNAAGKLLRRALRDADEGSGFGVQSLMAGSSSSVVRRPSSERSPLE